MYLRKLIITVLMSLNFGSLALGMEFRWPKRFRACWSSIQKKDTTESKSLNRPTNGKPEVSKIVPSEKTKIEFPFVERLSERPSNWLNFVWPHSNLLEKWKSFYKKSNQGLLNRQSIIQNTFEGMGFRVLGMHNGILTVALDRSPIGYSRLHFDVRELEVFVTSNEGNTKAGLEILESSTSVSNNQAAIWKPKDPLLKDTIVHRSELALDLVEHWVRSHFRKSQVDRVMSSFLQGQSNKDLPIYLFDHRMVEVVNSPYSIKTFTTSSRMPVTLDQEGVVFLFIGFFAHLVMTPQEELSHVRSSLPRYMERRKSKVLQGLIQQDLTRRLTPPSDTWSSLTIKSESLVKDGVQLAKALRIVASLVNNQILPETDRQRLSELTASYFNRRSVQGRVINVGDVIQSAKRLSINKASLSRCLDFYSEHKRTIFRLFENNQGSTFYRALVARSLLSHEDHLDLLDVLFQNDATHLRSNSVSSERLTEMATLLARAQVHLYLAKNQPEWLSKNRFNLRNPIPNGVIRSYIGFDDTETQFRSRDFEYSETLIREAPLTPELLLLPELKGALKGSQSFLMNPISVGRLSFLLNGLGGDSSSSVQDLLLRSADRENDPMDFEIYRNNISKILQVLGSVEGLDLNEALVRSHQLEIGENHLNQLRTHSIIGGLSHRITTELQKKDWYSEWEYLVRKSPPAKRILNYILNADRSSNTFEPYMQKTYSERTESFGPKDSYVDRVLTSMSQFYKDVVNPREIESIFDQYVDLNYSYNEATKLTLLTLVTHQPPTEVSEQFRVLLANPNWKSALGMAFQKLNIDSSEVLLLHFLMDQNFNELLDVSKIQSMNSKSNWFFNRMMKWPQTRSNDRVDEIQKILDTNLDARLYATRDLAATLLKGAIIFMKSNSKTLEMVDRSITEKAIHAAHRLIRYLDTHPRSNDHSTVLILTQFISFNMATGIEIEDDQLKEDIYLFSKKRIERRQLLSEFPQGTDFQPFILEAQNIWRYPQIVNPKQPFLDYHTNLNATELAVGFFIFGSSFSSHW